MARPTTLGADDDASLRRRRDHHHGLWRHLPVFPGRRYLDWDIPDPHGADLDTVRDVRDQIQAHITALLRYLDIQIRRTSRS